MGRERVDKYNGRVFVVTIERDTTVRRYALSTIEDDGSFNPQNEPLYSEDFVKHYGFSCEWPHEKINGASG